MSRPKILSVFGTRPEAIKMAVLVKQLASSRQFEAKVCVTGQHRQMLDGVLELFEIEPDFDLNLMQAEQDLSDLTAHILQGLTPILKAFQPDFVLVHGDTTTALATSLAAFYQKIPLAHIEAGLRTSNLYSPFPEEANRRLISQLAHLHLAPTDQARTHLLRAGISPEQVFVTGNTVIDALQTILQKKPQNPPLAGSKKLLVTVHRRENLGQGIDNLCQALRELVQTQPDLEIIFPLHLNPKVQAPVQQMLGGLSQVQLLPPQDYATFLALMQEAWAILTDSGGIQEEAAALGKPVLLMREQTERTENPNVVLVGTDSCKIVSQINRLLGDKAAYEELAQVQDLYGDGRASERIVGVLEGYFQY
ncbi:UDP-N-acetylglucosamine 2-epimerase [Pasteurellaceae bacterium RH1A]|nr:UDP-N-acetylglucosamine 2-epimerase [Pasteurellaceae bacterium RH1A]